MPSQTSLALLVAFLTIHLFICNSVNCIDSEINEEQDLYFYIESYDVMSKLINLANKFKQQHFFKVARFLSMLNQRANFEIKSSNNSVNEVIINRPNLLTTFELLRLLQPFIFYDNFVIFSRFVNLFAKNSRSDQKLLSSFLVLILKETK